MKLVILALAFAAIVPAARGNAYQCGYGCGSGPNSAGKCTCATWETHDNWCDHDPDQCGRCVTGDYGAGVWCPGGPVSLNRDSAILTPAVEAKAADEQWWTCGYPKGCTAETCWDWHNVTHWCGESQSQCEHADHCGGTWIPEGPKDDPNLYTCWPKACDCPTATTNSNNYCMDTQFVQPLKSTSWCGASKENCDKCEGYHYCPLGKYPPLTPSSSSSAVRPAWARPVAVKGSGTWSTNDSLHEKRSGFVMFDLNGALFACGGDTGVAGGAGAARLAISRRLRAQTADPYTNTCETLSGGAWKETVPMIKERFYGASAVVDGVVYVGGGTGTHPGSGAENTIESWDGKAKAWTLYLSTMPRGDRVMHAAAALDGKVFFIGGFHTVGGQLGPRADVDVFDTKTHTWSQGPDLNVPRAGASAATIGTKLYVCGGCSKGNCDQDSVEYSCEVYDGTTKTWSSSVPKLAKGFWQGGMVALGPRLFQVDGSNTDGTQNVVQYLDTATAGAQWTVYAPTAVWRQLPGVVALTEKNQLWACGGALAQGHSLNSCETLTPV